MFLFWIQGVFCTHNFGVQAAQNTSQIAIVGTILKTLNGAMLSFVVCWPLLRGGARFVWVTPPAFGDRARFAARTYAAAVEVCLAARGACAQCIGGCRGRCFCWTLVHLPGAGGDVAVRAADAAIWTRATGHARLRPLAAIRAWHARRLVAFCGGLGS